MECLPRFQRRSELQGHVSGDLKQLFDDGDVLVEAPLHRRIGYPLGNLARMLRGEIEHENGVLDLSLRLRLQAREAAGQFGRIGFGGCKRALVL